jgi:Domain of unknown function (DUF6457)
MLEAVTRDEWIACFARDAGALAPSVQETRELLDLAGIAAHASERTAAPLACWLAGRSGLELAELRAIAERLSAAEPQAEDGAEPGSPSGAGGPSRA